MKLLGSTPGMVWFATTLAKCRDCSKLGVRAGKEPGLFLEMDRESQLKIFTRYITGLNRLRDLFNLLYHRLRICAWCPEKPKSSCARWESSQLGFFVQGLLSFAIPWTTLTLGTNHDEVCHQTFSDHSLYHFYFQIC